MSIPIDLLRSLVWADYRLAVVFGVILPLGLLVWSVIKKAKPITHLLLIYWRVASLLAIAIYLMIDQNPIGIATGFSALVLIALSLWFWVDLNEEIEDRRGTLKLTLNTWRWAMTGYCAISALGLAPYLRCAASKVAITAAECQVWLEPPQIYKAMFHANTPSQKLGFLAMAALLFYGLYFGYYVLFRLTKQGRIAATES